MWQEKLKSMKRTSFCSLALLVLFSFGCDKQSSDYSDYFCEPESNQIDIRIDSLSFERISPEVSGVSYLGYSGIQGYEKGFGIHPVVSVTLDTIL